MKRIFSKRNLLIALAVIVVASGAVLLLSNSPNGGSDDTSVVSGQVWTCSMHPQVRLSKPGKCPICSMPLVPASKPASTNESSGSMLELSDHARAMASVETVPVERRKMSRLSLAQTFSGFPTHHQDGIAESAGCNETGPRSRTGD